MRLLGIDYGRKKIGLATAEGSLAEPWKVVKYNKTTELIRRLSQLVISEEIERVIVGVSEGEMGDESKFFARDLGRSLSIPVDTFGETLSTHDAQTLSIQAGIKRKKRKYLEDAFAAAVMLQWYLDKSV